MRQSLVARILSTTSLLSCRGIASSIAASSATSAPLVHNGKIRIRTSVFTRQSKYSCSAFSILRLRGGGSGGGSDSLNSNRTAPLTSNNTTTSSIVKRTNSTMTTTPAVEESIWNGADKDAFASKDHPGYTLESDPVSHTGGWWAHRAVWEEQQDDQQPSNEDGSSNNTNNTNNNNGKKKCWIKDEVVEKLTRYDFTTMPIGRGPRILVLYGSLRPTSFSKKSAMEFARLLDVLGCDVRVFNPKGLPVRDPALENDIKVLELRALTLWSEGHVWVSPEMHGTITGTFKNQIDWIPLNTGSVRPTQGRTCLVGQVNGGSQSFNAINALRLLARWMRMPCCTNQSSIAKAWKEFDDDGRMKESDFRDRVVDCAEEFAKFTAIMTPVADQLTDRYSERKEKEIKGRLLTQAEKEKSKTVEESRKA